MSLFSVTHEGILRMPVTEEGCICRFPGHDIIINLYMPHYTIIHSN